MIILKLAIISFIASTLYGYIFNAPKNAIALIGVNATIGFLIYHFFANNLKQDIWGIFIATFVISILSELFARILKMPTTIFLTSGMIPLVPGIKIYYTMLSFIQNDYEKTQGLLMQTLLTAVSIAFSIAITSTLFNFKKYWHKPYILVK